LENFYIQFSSPGILKIAMMQDMVWIDFLVSDLKLYYMGKIKTKKAKTPFN